jgi:hypothetical protein
LNSWKTVTVPQGSPAGSLPPDYSIPGDVIAEAIQFSDATGHVGIIVNNLQGQMASADSAVFLLRSIDSRWNHHAKLLLIPTGHLD